MPKNARPKDFTAWAEREWSAFFDSCDEDPNNFLADGVMGRESVDLFRAMHGWPGWHVTYMEKTLEPKARRVLASAARRIIQGEPLPNQFLFLLAEVIRLRLCGDISTLDAGFGLAKRRGRPPLDPEVNDHIVHAFLKASYEERCDGGTVDEQHRAGFEAAFKADHRISLGDARRNGVDEADLQRWMKKTAAVLKERGYWVDTPKSPD